MGRSENQECRLLSLCMICNNKFPEPVKKKTLGNQGFKIPIEQFYFSTLSLFPEGWLFDYQFQLSDTLINSWLKQYYHKPCYDILWRSLPANFAFIRQTNGEQAFLAVLFLHSMINWRTDVQMMSLTIVFVYLVLKTSRFHVSRHQNMIGTSATHSPKGSCSTFLFLQRFSVICDLLLNRRTAKWNLFVKMTFLQEPSHSNNFKIRISNMMARQDLGSTRLHAML